MKRLLICTACLASMLTVVVAVVMALGVEWVQSQKWRQWRADVDWMEAMSQ